MFILSIPEPCHERWDQMTTEAQGRFCGSCQKIVVDFTVMSDEQVKNYLLDKKNTNTCGRFYATQIGRPLENKNIQIDATWYQQLPIARQVFYAVAVFFVLGVSSCDFKVQGETIVKQDSIKQVNTFTQINSPIKVGSTEFKDNDTIAKAKVIPYSAPILTGDVAITDPSPVKELQGAPIWQEPLLIDTTQEIKGKIAAPQIPDTVKKTEPMIMGGISLPPKHFEKDSSIHIKKPRI